MTSPTHANTLADVLDAELPQTQCRQCGYHGCKPYAEAMAMGQADINRCPPGGTEGIVRLARLLGRAPLTLDPACGEERAPRLALITEAACIGCTLCIQACPVDAIAGAPKRMHAILLTHCTGCELCVPPCPVDCIEMVDRDTLAQRGVTGALARQALDTSTAREQARARHRAHTVQQQRLRARNDARLARKAHDKLAALDESNDATRHKREVVMRALARARQRRSDIAR
jgi:Na+-translocating ferredoxin:NAD+ oxidoreductase subunit B